MDLNASAPYEFLDLTDIDDNERKRLINTLYKTPEEEQISLYERKNKIKKTHGTTATTVKEYNKYSRFESSRYVKNVAVFSLPQQFPTNEKPVGHMVTNLVIPRFITPITFPLCAVIRPTLTEVAVVPLRTPIIAASAAVKTHAEQTRAKVSQKPVGNNSTCTMAQHTPALHHQQQQQQSQQQLVSTQTQVQQQQQQQAQQSTSQNNNLTNYPPPHPAQTHAFNQLPPSGVYMSSHGVSPVGGAMYLPCPVPTPLPGNVFVNNVTANVNVHGYMTHHVSPYIPGTTPAFIPGEVQQNVPHVSEQSTHVVPQGTNTPSSRGSRRGRGRGNSGSGRRNEYNQRQQQVSPAPPEVVNTPVDSQTLGTTAYQPYYSYSYPQPIFGAAAQNIAHPQAQQATGTPLYVASHVPMFPGPQVYNYQPQFIYSMITPEYQLLDEKGEEQSTPDGMIPQMWHAPMQMEYHEEFVNPELVEDVNHNHSPLTSSDTPSMLSPNYPIFESQIHSSIEIQQQMNALHIYDPQTIPQQHLQTEEQVQECQDMQSLSADQLGQSLQTPVPVEVSQIEQNVETTNTSSNTEEILTEVPPAPIVVDQTVHNSSNFVDNAALQQNCTNVAATTTNELASMNKNENSVTEYSNKNVPNIQTPQEDKSPVAKIENENSRVPTNPIDNSVQIVNKNQSWGGQHKKSTASVAVTATPSNTNKQNPTANANKTNNLNSASQTTQVKNYGVMKTPSSPVAVCENIDKKANQAPQTQSVESLKIVSTASIASTVVPQQLQDIKTTQTVAHSNRTEPVANTISISKDVNKSDVDGSNKGKKDEATSTVVPPIPASTVPVQQGPQSWASLFSNKSNTNVSSSITNATPAASAGSKKPVAKVFPFEGTSNFVPPASPGGMTYSAASAQGIQSQTSTNKVKSAISFPLSAFVKENIDEWSLKFADFLTKYKVDYSSVSLRPRGLTNRSNYCYINAILQALIGCPPFYNLMKSIPKPSPAVVTEKTNTPTINAMIQLISEFSHLPPGARLNRREKGQKKDELSSDLSCDPAFEPTGIYKLWNASRSDVEGRQEDAEEFLGYVLNKLNDEMLEVIKLIAKPSAEQNGDTSVEADDGEDWQMIYNNRNKGSVTRQTDFGRTPVSDIFRGELRSRLQREGEHSTDVIQPFFTLQLNIEKAASVKEALEILVGRDQLEGVTCSKTNQEVVAWQQMTLEKLPVVLILHLKWFDYKSDGCTKILKVVEFPVELKVDAKILANKKYSQKQRLYRLFAVVYHDGKEASKGHYITDVYHPGYLNWLRYDDSSVKPVSENNVLRPRVPRVPYLLYYRRCDTVQSTHNTVNSK